MPDKNEHLFYYTDESCRPFNEDEYEFTLEDNYDKICYRKRFRA